MRKEIPCDLIYEDDLVLFFKDINPQAKIHILGIPKMKVTNFNGANTKWKGGMGIREGQYILVTYDELIERYCVIFTPLVEK